MLSHRHRKVMTVSITLFSFFALMGCMISRAQSPSGNADCVGAALAGCIFQQLDGGEKSSQLALSAEPNSGDDSFVQLNYARNVFTSTHDGETEVIVDAPVPLAAGSSYTYKEVTYSPVSPVMLSVSGISGISESVKSGKINSFYTSCLSQATCVDKLKQAADDKAARDAAAAAASEAARSSAAVACYGVGHFSTGSGGTVVTPDGQTFSYSSVISCSATAYTTERQNNKITATGTTAHVGTVAVDPRLIPYGSKLYIVSSYGSWVYGCGAAEDCGGGIKGNKIDLFFDTYDECIQFGVRDALVYVLS